MNDRSLIASGGVAAVVPSAIEVDGRTLPARHVLIATAARPLPLGFPRRRATDTKRWWIFAYPTGASDIGYML